MVGEPLKRAEGRHRATGGRRSRLPDSKCDSNDEVGELAIRSTHEPAVALRERGDRRLGQDLEDRVDAEDRELKRAHEHVLHVEKMASIGKMAAVVAHEINNPLSGILTYARLVRNGSSAATLGTTKRHERPSNAWT